VAADNSSSYAVGSSTTIATTEAATNSNSARVSILIKRLAVGSFYRNPDSFSGRVSSCADTEQGHSSSRRASAYSRATDYSYIRAATTNGYSCRAQSAGYTTENCRSARACGEARE